MQQEWQPVTKYARLRYGKCVKKYVFYKKAMMVFELESEQCAECLKCTK